MYYMFKNKIFRLRKMQICVVIYDIQQSQVHGRSVGIRGQMSPRTLPLATLFLVLMLLFFIWLVSPNHAPGGSRAS